MSMNAASASARIASYDTTTTSLPSTVSTRTPSWVIFRYEVASLPSGNSGVWRYVGRGWEVRGTFMDNSFEGLRAPRLRPCWRADKAGAARMTRGELAIAVRGLPSRHHNRHRPPRLPGRLHGDLHILAERGEKFHQPSDREVARTVAHERGDMRLLDAEQFARLCLCQPACLDDLVDLKR